MTAAQPRFRRGMTIYRREELRERIRQEELERAIRRAEYMYVSSFCRNALALTLTGTEDAEYVRDLHGQCRGEIPGGSGCLCRCHDVVGEGVVSGHIEIPA